jgi:hypothetical protein
MTSSWLIKERDTHNRAAASDKILIFNLIINRRLGYAWATVTILYIGSVQGRL